MTLVLLQEVSNHHPPLTQLPNPTTKQIMLCDLGVSWGFHVVFAQTRKEICKSIALWLGPLYWFTFCILR